MWEALIAGFGILRDTLADLIKERANSRRHRQEIVAKLTDSCRIWSTELTSTFNEVVEHWAREGRTKAELELIGLINDETKLNYSSLGYGEILNKLRRDRAPEFTQFADQCKDFYDEALDLKDIFVGYIHKEDGTKWFAGSEQDVRVLVREWNKLIQQKMKAVYEANNRVQALD